MQRVLSLLVLCAAFVTIVTSQGFAQPDRFSWQGLLTDSLANPLVGPVDLTFKLYPDAIGGSPIWNQDLDAVSLSDGVANVALGPFGSVDFSKPLYLGVQINGGSEIDPRTPLTAVPRALSSSQEAVSFMAYLKNPDGFGIINDDLGIGEVWIVPFDQELYDLGEGFVDTSGVFRAPLAGIYLFSFRLECEGIACNDFADRSYLSVSYGSFSGQESDLESTNILNFQSSHGLHEIAQGLHNFSGQVTIWLGKGYEVAVRTSAENLWGVEWDEDPPILFPSYFSGHLVARTETVPTY